MFLIRYTGGEGSIVVALSPKPTAVDYPARRQITVKQTRDGGVLVQRALRDSRPRKWIWKNYPRGLLPYESLWAFLTSQETSTRWEAGEAEWVEVWEDETDEGGFGETTDGLAPDLVSYTNLRWTRVRFTQVHRWTRPTGGIAVYGESYVEFYISDPDWKP